MPLYDVSISVLCKDVPRLRCLSHEKLIRVSALQTVSRGRNRLAMWHLAREPDAIFQDAALFIPMSLALPLMFLFDDIKGNS